MSGARYLRRFSAARRQAINVTPDLSSILVERQIKILGIRRAITKLGASLTIDLEQLDAPSLEQMRVEIALQLSSRNRADTLAEQMTATTAT